MTDGALPGLHELIRDTVREVVAEMVAASAREALGSAAPVRVPADAPRASTLSAPAAGAREDSRSRTERVRIASDADLAEFSRRLLRLFENPKNRQDLRTGRLRFALAHDQHRDRSPGPAQYVERGAVTERTVVAAAEAGVGIRLGRRAVLTPLGREKARALGVAIEKECK